MSSIKTLSLLGGLAALALVAGCAAAPQRVAGLTEHPPTPLDKFTIGLHEAPDQVALGVHREGVSANQRDALAGFADRWRAAGGGYITLQTPDDCADVQGAKSYAESVTSTLGVMGVPYDHIRFIGYAGGGPNAKPVVLASFTHVVAEGPDCKSIPWENLSATKDNKSYNRFGCVVTANLAAQIADPTDLAGNVPLAPADNTRRLVVLGKYRDGKATSSDKDSQADGSVSQVVKQ
jgi:pilus assembly protein CpaD